MALGNVPQQTMEITMADKPKTTTSVDAIDREIHSVSTQGNQTVRVDVTYPYLDRESITITETTDSGRYPNVPLVTSEVILQRQIEEDYGYPNFPFDSGTRKISVSSSSRDGRNERARVSTTLDDEHSTYRRGETHARIGGRGYFESDDASDRQEAAIAIRRDLEGILDRDEARGGTVRQKMIEEGYKLPPQMRDNLPAGLRDFRDLPGGEGDVPRHGLATTAGTAAAAKGKGGRGE